MNDSCVFTIVSKNYISQARVLMKSFAEYHKDIKAFVLLADKIDGYFDPSQEPFEIVEADTLSVERFDSFSFKYNVIEFNTAIKPFAFQYFFSRCGFRKILYLDPDIFIFRPLTEIYSSLERYSAVLTPHIMSPLPDDGLHPREIDILKAGVFNLGFIGLARGQSTDRLLSWWQDRLYDKCLQGPLSGYAVDQIWMSLVPCFVEDFFVLRSPGYNVAYWNLHERTLTETEGEYRVNGQPLYFFHFSGFTPDRIDKLSKYQDRHDLRDLPAVNALLHLYGKLLIENGYRETSKWPYHYGFFKSGAAIPGIARTIYWGLGADRSEFGNPFELFWRKLLSSGNLTAFFTERFWRAVFDKTLIIAWNCVLKMKAKS